MPDGSGAEGRAELRKTSRWLTDLDDCVDGATRGGMEGEGKL